MHVTMRHTTRLDPYGALVAGRTYDLPDEVADHLLEQSIAARASKAAVEQASAEAPAPEPVAPPAPGSAAVTREGAAALLPDRPSREPMHTPKPLNAEPAHGNVGKVVNAPSQPRDKKG